MQHLLLKKKHENFIKNMNLIQNLVCLENFENDSLVYFHTNHLLTGKKLYFKNIINS